MADQTLATCPMCNGTRRVPAKPGKLYTHTYGYDRASHTLPCRNCGGQTMGLNPTGLVPIDPFTGLGCLHDYAHRLAGNCYHVYTCRKCDHTYDIDSGD